jgi:protein import protein ZIM17
MRSCVWRFYTWACGETKKSITTSDPFTQIPSQVMNYFRISRGLARHFEPLVKQRCLHTARAVSRTSQSPYLRRALSTPPKASRAIAAAARRHNSGLTAGGQKQTTQETAESEDRWANTPAYEMTFTCKQCDTRSSHKISKQGYHHGTVLINCPGCKNRHLISDHLKV